ncbi:MAG: hypothetical protein N5P05_001939 [Chroococcopsis gigantea SAG 12.99]|jgi:Uma2 family endonuclease|nr:Uma2 family endonuclease [Chlorogloea purpurea SAG 13.99]MDV3000333.1 hypothetical protein [Chroococcopsis gigantea SAG 12.99]
MVAQVQDNKSYTSDEYLELEVNSQERHEYRGGKIVSMTGGTPNHNQIGLNVAGALNFGLKRQPYRVFVNDQRLWIPDAKIYTYPDVMVVAGGLEFQEGRKDTITNPLLIVEVLSPSTRTYDKNDKFSAYRTIPDFQEYVLIEQDRIYIQHFYKTEPKKWVFVEYGQEEKDKELTFSSLPFQISLEDIYDKVIFAD